MCGEWRVMESCGTSIKLLAILDDTWQEGRTGTLRSAAALIRAQGVHRLATPEVRSAARAILADRVMAPHLEHLLHRLADSGVTQSCAYLRYIGADLLVNWQACDAPDTILQHAAHAIAERLEFLLWLPELKTHDRRDALENMTQRAISQLRAMSFTEKPCRSIDPLAIEMSLLPESGYADELIFMATTQSCETVFQAASDILHTVENHIVYARARQAADALSVAGRVLTFLRPLGGILKPMEVADWQRLRDFILLPSAIQSRGYLHMLTGMWNVKRLLAHDRYLEWEHPHVASAGVALLEFMKAVRGWESMHLGLAGKYGGVASRKELPDSLLYLDQQLKELEDVIRGLQSRYGNNATRSERKLS
jgi:tryptophan 2,3-dioxygenase